MAGGGRAQLEVAGPAAAVLRRGVGDLVELEHARDRALEEGAVVGDDHRAAGALGDEPLQPRQAVEVEVVGRLVEQQDVEAREQDRGQRRARGLAAGERRGLQVEQRGIQPEVAQDRLRALLQVGAAEREPRLERVGVAVRGAGRVRRQLVRGGLHARVGGGDAGAPREVVVQPLAGRAVGLLRQVAGGPAVSRTPPRSGRSSPARRRSSVDFPAPLGPTTPSTSPGATVTETPARIVAAPCALCRSRAIRVPATRWSVRSRRARAAGPARTPVKLPPHARDRLIEAP